MTLPVEPNRILHSEDAESNLPSQACQGHWTSTLEIPAVHTINMDVFSRKLSHKSQRHYQGDLNYYFELYTSKQPLLSW